jgi:hypothetical protein
MRLGKRLDGGAHELIDQILALSHRQLPARVAAVTRPGDTANIRYMRQAVFYGRTALERRDEAEARSHASSVFANQQLAGHMCWPGDTADATGYRHRIEQMAADPHYGFHVAAVALITLAAGWWRHADVRAQGEDWLRRHLAVVKRCAAPDGAAAFPCTRARTNPPLWDVATGVLREVLRLPHQGPLARKPDLPDRQGWWVPIRLARLLAGDGADLVPREGELPYLRIPLSVTRHPWGHLATMGPVPHVGWIADPVDWVLMRYASAPRVEYGRSWTKAPPRVDARGPIETR